MTDFTTSNDDHKPAATGTVMTMTRRHFNSYLYDLYECRKRGVTNDVAADMMIDDVSHVDVLVSPEGPLIAVHHGGAGELVTVFPANIDPADLSIEVNAA